MSAGAMYACASLLRLRPSRASFHLKNASKAIKEHTIEPIANKIGLVSGAGGISSAIEVDAFTE